ncbi:MAG: DNA helicase UvrD, partial [Deltaproteobacteria bacterium]|nr:DNA helicase UvrD [Deltaproteobacteria bacterium]
MPKRPRNSAQVLGSALNPRERKIIAEELAILDSLRTHLNDRPAPLHESHYDEALIELRDSLGEARTDELAQIVNQMSTLASLSGHTQQRQAERPIDKDSPYFGHMRVRQEGRERDILIGSRTLISGGLPYPIIDWRHAPISRVFYSYKEGDEYEEEIGGREVEGEVLAHRRLMIVGGHLVRIDCPQGVYHRTGEQWEKIQTARPSLTGGAGTAPRPASALGGRLGVGSALTEGDKHLRAITGLIDAEQFEIIARPESGIVVVDGGAGSGKTTIALHRMAYLAYRDPERFAPERMMAVVYSRALAIYISQLLPALGVSDVRIEVFEEFMSALRQQHYPSLAADYVSLTPTAVMRFKQHPLTLNYLQDYVRFRLGELRSGLERALG